MTTPTPSPEAEALPTLPVDGWRADDHSLPHFALTREGLGLLGPRYGYALTRHAPAEAVIVALRAEVADLRKERDALIQAGALMANTMFNLAQQTHKFGEYHCKLFKSMQVKWDTARASLLGDGGTL